MSSEIEAKLAVASHDPVRARLAQCGAERLGRVLETNSIYDRFDTGAGPQRHEGRLFRAGSALRVRSVDILEGGEQRATITLKGPIEPGRFKKREELELAISDADGMRRLLAAVGFVEVLRFAKRRESWRLAGCRVELDELPKLGCFVEIEGPSEDAIHAVREQLGLAETDSIARGYPDLLAEACRSTDPFPLTIEFESIG